MDKQSSDYRPYLAPRSQSFGQWLSDELRHEPVAATISLVGMLIGLVLAVKWIWTNF